LSGKTTTFIKENLQFFYSLILILLIPVAIIANTLWDIKKSQGNMELELQKKAELVTMVFASTISDSLDNNALLQSKINEVTGSSKEIKEITILEPQDEGFIVVASSEANNLGVIYKSLQNTSAWVEDKTIPTLVSDASQNPPERYWVIISPLKNTNLEEKALIDLKISLAEIDAATRAAAKQTLIVLTITVFAVLLLLINHFRFFEYAVLFKRLKEVDKMKDDFISIASHELKTPMAAIKGYMGMLFEGVAGKFDAKAKDHLNRVMGNVRRLDVLVNELLDVSRLEQERIQFDMQAMDIAKIITEVTNELTVQAEEKKLSVEYQPLPPPHPLIFADPDRIAQILDNVIGNALKYTFRGGVVIYHRIEGNYLKTTVKDTGVGISLQDQKHLFERFHRIRTEKTMDIPGTGLGLWIARELVLRMNGKIYATSQENVGSEFTIAFPIIRETKK